MKVHKTKLHLKKGNLKNDERQYLTIPSRCQIPVRPPSNETVGITCGDMSLDMFTKDNVYYIKCGKLEKRGSVATI